MRRLKILIFCHRLDRTGAPIMLMRLVRALRDRHDFELLLTVRPIDGGPLLEDYKAMGIPIRDGAAVEDYDLVLANTIIAGKLANQTKGRIPSVWWIHEPKAGVAFIRDGKVELDAFQNATTVVFPTRWQAENLYAPWLEGCDWTVVPYGIGVDSTPHPRPREMPDGCFSLVVLGWLGERKGQHLAIRAVRDLARDDIHLFLLGATDQQPKFTANLKQHVQDVPHLRDKVHVLGPRPEDDVNAFLQHADALLYPTNDDLISLAILEAMHHRTCVIASDFGPIPETVIDGETGLLFPVNDDKTLARQIARIHEDPDLKHRLAAGGNDIYRRKHGFREHVEAMERVLLEAVEKGPTGT